MVGTSKKSVSEMAKISTLQSADKNNNWALEPNASEFRTDVHGVALVLRGKNDTMWGPRSIAKLVQITPITMVYGTYNELVTAANLNQLITGGPHIAGTWSVI